MQRARRRPWHGKLEPVAARVPDAALAVDDCELALMESDDEPTQMRYAHAIADYAEAGGYGTEVLFDVVTTAALGEPFERVRWRPVLRQPARVPVWRLPQLRRPAWFPPCRRLVSRHARHC